MIISMKIKPQSDSLVKVKVQIPHNQKPILLLDRISYNGKTSSYIVSTFDSWFHIFEVKDSLPSVKHSYQTDHCVCQYYWSRERNIFYLGTLAGDILQLDLGNSVPKLSKKYKETNPTRPQIICMYQRNSELIIINLNSEVMIVRLKNWQIVQKFNLNQEILSAIWAPNPCRKDRICAYIAFNNSQYPILFDCQQKQKFLAILSQMTRYHKSEELEEDKISNMTFSINYDNFYLIASGVSRIDSQKGVTSFVSVYKVLEYSAYYELERWYKFEITGRIQNLSTHENRLVIIYWEAMSIINLDSRSLGPRLTVSHNNVGWAFLIWQNSIDCCLLTGRGFNVWDPTNKERKIGIYVAKLKIN